MRLVGLSTRIQAYDLVHLIRRMDLKKGCCSFWVLRIISKAMRFLQKFCVCFLGSLLISPSIHRGQTEENPLGAYLTAPVLQIVESETLVPEAVARLLPQAGLVRLTSEEKKGLPLLFVGSFTFSHNTSQACQP